MKFDYRPIGTAVVAFVAAWALLVAPQSVFADEVTYQGELRVAGQPWTGIAQMKFIILNADTGKVVWAHDGQTPGGNPFQPATSVAIPVSSGLFSVALGSNALPNMALIPNDAFKGVTNASLRLYVQTTGGFELFSDQPLHSGLQAHRALSVEGDVKVSASGIHFADGSIQTTAAGMWMSSGSNTTITSGNVGIGTASPQFSLDVVASNDIRLGLHGKGGGQLVIGSNSNDNSVYLEAFNAAGSGSAAQLLLTGANAQPVPSFSVIATKLFLSGNVGVGTPNPQSKLDVIGEVRTSGGIRFADNSVQTTAAGMWMTSGSNTTITSGLVGIGTATPEFSLDVVASKDIRLGLHGNGGGQLVIASNANDNSVYLEAFDSSGSGSASQLLLTGASAQPVPSFSVIASKLFLSGNVGVGTPNPQAKLDVIGEVRTAGGIRFADGSLQTSAQSAFVALCQQGVSGSAPTCTTMCASVGRQAAGTGFGGVGKDCQITIAGADSTCYATYAAATDWTRCCLCLP